MPNTILIIGAGPGIGAATAARFGAEGWRVILASRSEATLTPLAETLVRSGVRAEVRTVDAGDPGAVRKLIGDVAASSDGLSTVLYNAAVLRQASVFDMTDEEIATDLAVDVAGALAAIAAAGAALAKQGGTILLTGGGLALHPQAQFLTLGIGKAAVRHIAEALKDELAAKGVHIATVTVSESIKPGSAEAAGVADRFWALQTQSRTAWSWEATYP